MKTIDKEKFEQNKYTDKFVFFVEVMLECLFDYSFESYRVPSLNAHFLCYDICSTAKDINNKVLLDGNFIPLSEEFEYCIKNDFVLSKFLDSKTLTLISGKNGIYTNITTQNLSTKIKYYPEIANYITSFCEADNQYINIIYNQLIDNIFDDSCAHEHFSNIYKLSRDLACELMNIGFDKFHIYQITNKEFVETDRTIPCTLESLTSYFDLLTCEEKTYSVTFGVNQKMASLFKNIENVSIEKSSAEDNKMLDLNHKNSCLATIIIESLDLYSAYSIAKEFFGAIVSFHSLNQHKGKLFVSKKAIVSQLEGDNIITTEVICRAQNLMQKKGNIPYEQSLILDMSIIGRESTPQSFYKAVSLHNDAVESKKTTNQLLNLWTCLEILINTKRDNEDRINTICNVLGSTLNRSYMYSLLAQLNKDITNLYCDKYDELLNSCTFGSSELDNVQKLAIILSVNEFQDKYDQLKNIILDPLLSYRLVQFHDIILVDSKSIFNFLMQHKKRVRWHIMRIYRNRNMIVHNGSFMPYLDTITENLHYYVDSLIDTLIDYYIHGIDDNESIYRDIINDETLYFVNLGCSDLTKKVSVKEPIDINEDNALSLVFNNYSGNSTHKAIDEAVKNYHNSDEPVG